jgi:hypothetical protein
MCFFLVAPTHTVASEFIREKASVSAGPFFFINKRARPPVIFSFLVFFDTVDVLGALGTLCSPQRRRHSTPPAEIHSFVKINIHTLYFN